MRQRSVTKRALLAALVAIAAVANPNVVAGQSWPTRPVKFVVGTGPGIATDLAARLIGDHASRDLGQPVVIENVAGAGGLAAAQAVLRSPPDGYTMLFGNPVSLANVELLFSKPPYEPFKVFTPVAVAVDNGPLVISVNASLPVRTLAELIAYAKANKGTISYGVDASAAPHRIIGRYLNKTDGGLGMSEIAYRAGPQAVQDAASGQIQVIVSSVAAVSQQAGKIRMLAISSQQRFPGLEDLPTIGETLPGFHLEGMFVIAAPTGTPREAVTRVNEVVNGALSNEDIRKRLLLLGVTISRPRTPEGTGEVLRSEHERWKSFVNDLAIEKF